MRLVFDELNSLLLKFTEYVLDASDTIGDGSHAVVASKRSNRGSNSSDSGTVSTSETLMDTLNTTITNEPEKVPPTVPNERPPLRYPTAYSNPNSGHMQAIWPSSAGKNVAGSKNMTPLWPPNSLNRSLNSFDVLTIDSGSSSENGTPNLDQKEYADFLQRTGAREFEVPRVSVIVLQHL